MKNNHKNSRVTLSAVSQIIFGLLLSLLWTMPASAHISPAGCTGSGLGINLFSNVSQVHIGDVISYSVDVFNGASGGTIVCDATSIQASIVTPDGQNHPITLVRTSLSSGQVDSYPNVVTYTSRLQDVKPDGTLTATASDTGVIHQNVVDSQGGGNQGLNVRVLNALHVIKLVVNGGGGTAVPSGFTLHVKNAGMDVAGSPAAGTGAPGTLYSLFAGTYAVSENPNPSYTQSFSGSCDASGTVSLLAGDDKTCTITNTFIPPATLHVVKVVVNTGGGTAVPSGFTLHVTSAGVDVAGSPAAGVAAPGTSYTLPAGTYLVSENVNASYTQSVSGDCNAGGSVTLAPGVDRTCTITNTFIPPATLHVVKVVVNTGGGTASSSDFSLHVKNAGVDVSGSPAAGVAAPGTAYLLSAGTYVVSENASSSYSQSVSGDCNSVGSVTLTPGVDRTCTITNTFNPLPIPLPATLHVVKLVVNGSGGTAIPPNFTLHVTSAGIDVAGSPAAGVAAPGTSYSLPAGTYAVSENANASYVQSFSGSCDSSGNITLTVGGDSICTIINTDIPPPAPFVPTTGGGGSTGNRIVPLIGILKVPTPLALPGGSGSVTYNYTVWNVGGAQSLINVTVTDDKCSPVKFVSGDTNGNGKLDPHESWNYTCTTTLGQTTTNTAVATGYSDDGFHQAAIATAIATVVVTPAVVPGLPNTGLLPPLINVVKVPSRLTPFPFGGGNVTYTYTVTNPGMVSMHDVTVLDDKCAPVSRTSSDANNNGLLDPGESWIYTCTTKVSISTRNVATAQGVANGFTALGYAFATVLVSAPGLPNTGLPPGGNEVAWNILTLFGIIVGVSASLVMALKKRRV